MSMHAISMSLGTWNVYTPTWTATGTAPALGNGTLQGRYVVIGNTCVCWFQQINGSTTTYGTGTYFWSLPVAAINVAGVGGLHGFGLDSSSSINISFWMFVDTTVRMAAECTLNSGTTQVRLCDAASPIVWAQSDQLKGGVIYEI